MNTDILGEKKLNLEKKISKFNLLSYRKDL